MRILYSHRIQSHDGQGVHLEALVAALRAAGHEVRVVGPAGYARAGLGGESGTVALVRRLLPGFTAELAELAYSIPAWLRLARAAREFRPDVLYERANLFHLAGALLARGRGLPFLLEVNSPLAEERARFGRLRLRRLARAAERFVWRSADRVLPVTEVLAGHVAAAGVPRERIEVVPNGIDFDDFPAPAADTPEEGAELTLGFVGFVRDWHGLDAVIREIAAWQGQPRLALLVVGEGPARPGLERLAAELGVAGRVRFTGLADRAAVPGLVAGFDIALQPAAVAYASPLKVFEYMAAGRAILAPDQPNLREVLEDGRTALLFDPALPGALWQGVLRLAADPVLRARLGAAARAEVLRRDLTWAGNARRVLALAEAELARRRAADGRLAAPPGAEQPGGAG
ncbi:glycosyltransferase family 4 protein [Siccirubricoccus sp. G192]|uniref:glycosyltransferase family 4 protein n=1 Tax=Siccirubricoccus sp. G192 TaxID=2849651 RepID=UPI001C2BBD28|nr:glycosyltransferase family 4 protein [Siccirubricoccus sp. G192]MBV1799983.1 glycosyltransferase family 4 protein [Siccirubricoccus sp. G192]